MLLELTDSLKELLKETAFQLKGAQKRRFNGTRLFRGDGANCSGIRIWRSTIALRAAAGRHIAERELGWNRCTIYKGMKELKSGMTCVDNYSGRGRKNIEEHLPRLLSDIKELVDSQTQTDPSFKSQRLYTRLSAAEVRKQLIEKFGYSDEELPSEETIRVKLNCLGYNLKRVALISTSKKIPPDGSNI